MMAPMANESNGDLQQEAQRKQVLAASAPWLGALLNVLPGLGSGYIYQRRWRAYWITTALATAWFVLGAVLGQEASSDAEAQNSLVGLVGLLLLAGEDWRCLRAGRWRRIARAIALPRPDHRRCRWCD